jgi:hypothetical protein
MTTGASEGARVPRRWPRRGLIAGLLTAAFAVRLAFGVTSEFWGGDELQIYLIGLKFYTTGEWPLFGPDVVYTETRIPGALQGLLVGGPLWIVAEPEAPYVVLNVLTLGALVLLGWYVGRRVPDVPAWWLWGMMLFSPWTLDVSTHIINTSYVLVGSVVFFVSVFELVPALRTRAWPRPLAFFGLGFGALWVYQFHLSAALLGPIATVVVFLAAREDPASAARGLAWAAAGAAVAGATVIPTLLAAGPAVVAGQTRANVVFEPGHLLRLPQIVLQFFSFGSFEVPRFIGSSTADRLGFLARYPWAAPFVVVAALIGVAQVAILVAALFWKPDPRASSERRRDWQAVRTATVLLLALVAASFTLSIKAPASHVIYIVMPVVMMYAFSCWASLLHLRAVRLVAILLLVSGVVTHLAIAVRNFTDRSLYTNRAAVVRAIDEKNHRHVGERRSDAWGQSLFPQNR